MTRVARWTAALAALVFLGAVAVALLASAAHGGRARAFTAGGLAVAAALVFSVAAALALQRARAFRWLGALAVLGCLVGAGVSFNAALGSYSLFSGRAPSARARWIARVGEQATLAFVLSGLGIGGVWLVSVALHVSDRR